MVPYGGIIRACREDNLLSVLLISIQPDLDIIGLKGLHQLLLERGRESMLLYLPRVKADPSTPADEWERPLCDFIGEKRPACIGISLVAKDFPAACDVTKAIKSAYPDIPIVWGGIHPTTSPEVCVEYADYACVGEAEQTMLDMADAARDGRSFDSINNLCFKRNGEFVRNPLYPLVEDLDSLPGVRQLPPNAYVMVGGRIEPMNAGHLRRYRYGFRGALYKILSSRGCPHNCTYCCNHFLRQLYGRWPIRQRSVEHVISEMESAMREGPRVEYFDLTDDCFLATNVEYVAEFCKAYKARIGVPFIVKGTARYFTKDKMDLLVDAGLGWINMGLQSGSDRTCQEIFDRRVSAEGFLEAARLINRYPVAAYYDLIVDNPFETDEDRLQTIYTLMRTPKPFFVLIFSLTFFEGTMIRKRALQEIPHTIEEPSKKDYLVRNNSQITELIEMAPFLPTGVMQRLVDAYRTRPNARRTLWTRAAARTFCRLVLAPITLLRSVWRSQHGSPRGFVRVVPIFFDHAILHYLNHFAIFKRRSLEPKQDDVHGGMSST